MQVEFLKKIKVLFVALFL